MARKRKRPPAEKAAIDKPTRIGTGLGALLQRELSRAPVADEGSGSTADGGSAPTPEAESPPRATPPLPTPTSGPPDARSMRLLNDAYAGTTPLRATRQARAASAARRAPGVAGPSATPFGPTRGEAAAADAEARTRLGELVGAGVVFHVERDEDGRYAGLREGVARTALRRLRGPDYKAEAALDLHGMRAEEAAQAVTRFVRQRHRGGARYLLIIVGAGNHSEAGLSVLAPRTIEALTDGGAAPLVQAFATAHARRGGLGALSVQLK